MKIYADRQSQFLPFNPVVKKLLPHRRKGAIGDESRRSISPQSTQKRCWLRRLLAWLTSLHRRDVIRALTTAPHCGQKRTGDSERR
jgi:hypothetical protein